MRVLKLGTATDTHIVLLGFALIFVSVFSDLSLFEIWALSPWITS